MRACGTRRRSRRHSSRTLPSPTLAPPRCPGSLTTAAPAPVPHHRPGHPMKSRQVHLPALIPRHHSNETLRQLSRTSRLQTHYHPHCRRRRRHFPPPLRPPAAAAAAAARQAVFRLELADCSRMQTVVAQGVPSLSARPQGASYSTPSVAVQYQLSVLYSRLVPGSIVLPIDVVPCTYR